MVLRKIKINWICFQYEERNGFFPLVSFLAHGCYSCIVIKLFFFFWGVGAGAWELVLPQGIFLEIVVSGVVGFDP